MTRLVPPWQPMTVVAETESLADGKAVLCRAGCAGSPSTTATASIRPTGSSTSCRRRDRDPAAPRDRLVAAHPRVLRGARRWPRVRDEVDTTVPGVALRPTFVYRHRQLADDLAAHRDAAARGAKPMVVAVTGASGSGRRSRRF